MPLDIRSFFKNKADPNHAKPNGGGGGGGGAPGAAVRRGGGAKKATESSPNRKKRLVVLDDTSSDDDDKHNNNRNSGSDVEDEAETRPRPAARKRKSGNVDDDGNAAAASRRKEVSPEEFFGGGASKVTAAAAASPSPAKKAKRASVPKAPPPTAAKKTSKAEEHRDRLLQPTVQSDRAVTSSSQLRPGCLSGLTFVFSGILEGLARDDSQELVKELGGRVTTAVSSKTDYLVVGLELEDGRPFNEGSKYKKAMEIKTIIVEGVERFYGLLLLYDDKARAEAGEPPRNDSLDAMETNSQAVTDASTAESSKVASPARYPPASARSNLKAPPGSLAATGPVAVPSTTTAAKAPAPNPYAKRKANPYATAKKPAAAAVVKAPAAKTASRSDTCAAPSTLLWVDKYKPQTTSDILGNQDCVRKLAVWLRSWEARFNTPQAIGKSFAAPQGPWKAALLSGPPGIGKTTTATLVAKEDGRDLLEFNASDVRSKSALHDCLGDITGSRTLEFQPNKKRTKRCIIMDEVDGMGGGDRGGIASLIQLIKNSQVPIVCICNDRQSQKIKSLVPYCMDLRYRRPVKTTLAKRAVEIAAREGLVVEPNAAEALSESCGNDVRQIINALQMWKSDGSSTNMSYKDLKERQHSINKDEVLRVSLFDAARTILEGRRGLSNTDDKAERDHLFRRDDAFFVDYNFIGLIVQQNYLKVVQGDFTNAKKANNEAEEAAVLERMYQAADSMSDFDLVSTSIMESQNWTLLPFSSICTVKTGFHAGGPRGGFLPGFPEFTAFLGKNSTRQKKVRLLQELQHHANYRISGATHEMRTAYIPMFRDRLLSLLQSNDGSGVEAAIDLMDEYGLDRDDVFETLDEFSIDPKADTFAKLDSKKKAAFTRTYNAGVHKSQALVDEQGGTKPARRAASSVGETKDLDVIDEDAPYEDEAEDGADEDDDDEADHEKIKSMFKPSFRKGKAATAKTAAASKAKTADSKGKGRPKKK